MKNQRSTKSAHRAMALVALVGAVIHIGNVNASAQTYYNRLPNGKCPPATAGGKLVYDNWSATAGVKVGPVGANGTYRSAVATANVCISDPNTIRDVRSFVPPPDPRRPQPPQTPPPRQTSDSGVRPLGSMSVRTTTPATSSPMFRRL